MGERDIRQEITHKRQDDARGKGGERITRQFPETDPAPGEAVTAREKKRGEIDRDDDRIRFRDRAPPAYRYGLGEIEPQNERAEVGRADDQGVDGDADDARRQKFNPSLFSARHLEKREEKRGGENERVEHIEKSAEPGRHEGRGILNVDLALETAFDKVAQRSDQCRRDTEREGLVPGELRHRNERARNEARGENRTGKALPALVRRNRRAHLMPAESLAESESAHIGNLNNRDYVQ